MYHICVCIIIYCILSFPRGSAGKESACYVGDLGSIPGLGRFPGEGNGYLLQYSGLENSMDHIVYGVTKSRTWLSNFHSLILYPGQNYILLIDLKFNWKKLSTHAIKYLRWNTNLEK